MNFLEHIEEVIGKEEKELLYKSSKEKEVKCLRINPFVLSKEYLLNKYPNLKQNPDIDYSFYYDKEEYELGKSIEHFSGGIYIQDASAMLVTHLLNPLEGEKVIDLCAAPGGKATQAAILMKNKGLVVANDYNKKRSLAIVENVERLGLTNMICLNEDANELTNHFGGYFDKVILDAPCSGEGMFRRNELAYIDWSIDKVKRLADIQKELILNAYKLLKKDGVMVYSTCTFEKEENEDVVKYLLENTNASLIPIQNIEGAKRGIDMEEAIRLYPSHYQGEGQFACLIKCNDDNNVYLKKYKDKNKNTSSYLKIINSFIKENSNDEPLKDLLLFKDNVYYLENGNINIDGLKVKNYGLHLGKIVNNRLEPSHVFMKKLNLKNNLEINEEELQEYLKGNVLYKNLKGYVAIKYNGMKIGFGKASNNQIKNHLPKYLRK